ncbi:MAG: hypothetical protein AAFN74_17855, partial [Myxococcota bacterium]
DNWTSDLRQQVRRHRSLWSSTTVPTVALQVDEALSYEQLIAALSAADGACAHAYDCGLPGLGLRFFLAP